MWLFSYSLYYCLKWVVWVAIMITTHNFVSYMLFMVAAMCLFPTLILIILFTLIIHISISCLYISLILLTTLLLRSNNTDWCRCLFYLSDAGMTSEQVTVLVTVTVGIVLVAAIIAAAAIFIWRRRWVCFPQSVLIDWLICSLFVKYNSNIIIVYNPIHSGIRTPC